MKYKSMKIIEDKNILEGISLRKLAKQINCHFSYLFRLRNEETIATEEFYHQIVEARKRL